MTNHKDFFTELRDLRKEVIVGMPDGKCENSKANWDHHFES